MLALLDPRLDVDVTRLYRLELYVNIPPQAPGPGQEWRTTSNRSSSVILPTAYAPDEPGASIRLSRAAQNVPTEGFECINSSHIFTFLVSKRGTVNISHTRLNGASVNNNGRSVVADSGHNGTGHILVAAR